jgi:hypothetical protein
LDRFYESNESAYLVVQIRTTETGVCDLDKDLTGLDLTGRLCLDNLAGLATLVYCEFNHVDEAVCLCDEEGEI